MAVPLFTNTRQHEAIEGEIFEAIKRVFDHGQFILGREVEDFEKSIAKYLGTKCAVGVSNGSDALVLILQALDLGPKDAVITTPFTFFSTASAIERVGATPVFIDIEPETFNLSYKKLLRFLKSCDCNKHSQPIEPRSKKVIRAVILVHLFGLAAGSQRFYELCKRSQLHLVEDVAQAIGTKDVYKKNLKFCGTFGVASAFSFFPTKNLGGAGDGGLVTTDDESIASRIRMLREHGQKKRYVFEELGLNARLDALQAAILKVKLKYLDFYNSSRRKIAELYLTLFKKYKLDKKITLPYKPAFPELHSYHQFVIRTPMRDELQKFLEKRRIGTSIYYPLALHLQAAFNHLGYKQGDFPESEKASKEVLALPMFPELTEKEVEEVVAAIAEFFEGKR